MSTRRPFVTNVECDEADLDRLIAGLEELLGAEHSWSERFDLTAMLGRLQDARARVRRKRAEAAP